jgi:MFS family permease
MGLFQKPWLAASSACFADFFGLNSLTPTLPIFLLAWATVVLGPGNAAAAWSRTWTGAILTTQSFAKIAGHLIWGTASARLGARTVLLLVMVCNAIAFGASALFAIHGMPLDVVVGLLAVRLLAGLAAPIVPSLVFLFERQEPGPALVASVGKIGGGILTGLTLGGAAVAIPFGGPSAIWAGVCLLSAGIALLVLVPVYKAPPVLGHIVQMRKQKPEGVLTALMSNEYITHVSTLP